MGISLNLSENSPGLALSPGQVEDTSDTGKSVSCDVISFNPPADLRPDHRTVKQHIVTCSCCCVMFVRYLVI